MTKIRKERVHIFNEIFFFGNFLIQVCLLSKGVITHMNTIFGSRLDSANIELAKSRMNQMKNFSENILFSICSNVHFSPMLQRTTTSIYLSMLNRCNVSLKSEIEKQDRNDMMT